MVRVPQLAFYVVGSISIGLSAIVILMILRLGIISSYSRLVMYLQLTVLLQEISSYPHLYIVPLGLCDATAAFKQYFTLCNLVVNFVMSYYTYTIIFTGVASKFKLSPRSQLIMFTFPLIMLLPLFTNSYGAVQNKWCTFKSDTMGASWNGSLMVIQLLVNLAALGVQGFILIRLNKHGSGNMRTMIRVIRGSTFYCVVTVCCWAPKIATIPFSDESNVVNAISFARFFTFFSGAFYFVIFIIEREMMHSFEREVAGVDALLTSNIRTQSTSTSNFARSTEIDLSIVSSRSRPDSITRPSKPDSVSFSSDEIKEDKRGARVRDLNLNAAFGYEEGFEF
jgi:hypothetical protein